MFYMFVLFCLCWCHLIGVFGVDEVKSVTEGDSVTLNSGVTEISKDEDIMWKFGAKTMSLIAEVSKASGIFSTFDVPDGRFRDRLKLDNKTGSLTIINTTTEHAGRYEVQRSGNKWSSKMFKVSVYARLPVPKITRDCPSSSPSSSSLKDCSVVCSVVNVSHVTLSWLKGNSLLSSISVSDLSISLSLPLEVEDQDTNNYSCVLNNSITHQTTHLDISGVCQPCPDEGLPLLNIVLISASAGSLLIVAVVLMCCICKKCREKVETQEEDETNSSLCKPTTRKAKSKAESVYENVPKKR